MATNYLFAQSEKIGAKMPEWFSQMSWATNMINDAADVELVGERDFRQLFLAADGGKIGFYNPDGGAIGRGSAAEGGVLISTFKSLRLAMELTELATKATQSKEVSMINAFRRAMKKIMPEMAIYVDKMFHISNGTAVAGTASAVTTWSGGTKTVYTMDTVFGARALRRGMSVIPYVANLSAAYDSGAERKIEKIDVPNRLVYLDGLVTSPLATDKLVYAGSSGASPVGLNGLQFHHSSATTGTYLGLDRATEPEVVTNYVSGSSGAPKHMKILQLLHQMLHRRGEIPDGLLGLLAPEQEANMRQEVLDLSIFDLSAAGVDKDLMAKPQMKRNYGGIPWRLTPHQPATRVDIMIPADWGKVCLEKGPKFYEIDGDRFFPLYDSTTGSPLARMWFAVVLHMNWINRNPGQAAYMDTLALPTY